MKTSKFAAAAILAASLFVVGCEEEAKKASDATSDAAKKVEDGAAKAAEGAKDAGAKAADATGNAMDAAKDTAKDAGAKAADAGSNAMGAVKDMGAKAADAAGDAMKALGDPAELLKKAEGYIGEGKIADAKALLEKIKPHLDKLPADLQTKAKDLLGKVGL